MNISLTRKWSKGEEEIWLSASNNDRCKLAMKKLVGCPFNNYFAMDLLRDLVKMYSCRMEYGVEYSIGDFLTLCRDTHAEAYRFIYEA